MLLLLARRGSLKRSTCDSAGCSPMQLSRLAVECRSCGHDPAGSNQLALAGGLCFYFRRQFNRQRSVDQRLLGHDDAGASESVD